VKPFAFTELVARLRALLRRVGSDEPLRQQCANLVLDLRSRQVTRAGRKIPLTPHGFDLLAYLLALYQPFKSTVIAALPECWKINFEEVGIALCRTLTDELLPHVAFRIAVRSR
jgi:hypothetical protein